MAGVVSETAFIVIPAYNEETAIGEVVAGLRGAWPNIVVVDDGSHDGTSAAAAASGATVLRHMLNRGQGAAVMTGIAYALRKGAKYIVTFDSDGQHRAEDLPQLIEPVVRGEADVALGSRFLGSTEAMPRRRRLLLRLAVFFTRAASGARFTDTHNGLRAFSRHAAEVLDIRMDRMAHASEILDQIVANGLRWKEVPVHVRYTEYSRRKGQRSSGAIRVLIDYLQGRWLQ